MKTLLIGKIHDDALQLLQERTQLEQVEQLEDKHYDHKAIVLRTFTEFKEQQIANFPNLKYVVSCSVGLDNLDLNLLKERGVEVIFVPATNANSVAEHTLHLMLSVLREDIKKPYAELKGKTVGIIGFGAIGKLVAKKLAGFECNIIAFDVIKQDSDVLKELNTVMKDYDDVLREADMITVHVPLNKHTRELVSATSFERMKWGSFFINTSRAEVIEEQALIDDFRDGRFRGVALDVYSENLKQKLEAIGGNVIFTQHVAAQGEDSFRNQCVKPVEVFLEKI